MKYRLFIPLLVTLFSLQAEAQNTPDSLAMLFPNRIADRPGELIYLQTSKGIYETGEDLWFKTYHLDAQSFGLSDGSKTLYLQMVDEKDSVVWKEKYPIVNGLADGHVYVDRKLPEGDYFLEAYTRHSFYADSTEIVAARKVKILDNIAHAPSPLTKEKRPIRFETFPEGGNLVAGITSRVAFKATDGRGNAVEVEGTLFEDEHPLVSFKSIHDGMGFLYFTPFKDKKYRIELKEGGTWPLSEIYPQGMVLRVSKQNKEQISFIVSQNEGLPAQEIMLVGQIRGMVCCVAKGILKNNVRMKIPLKEFPYQGIAQFTLFDSAKRPIAERLVYVHPERKLCITLEPEKKKYATREQATLKIRVTDDTGKPVRANLGISVADQAYSNPADPANLLTHCYLSSQLRGKLYNPAYYFDEANKDRREALDLLLQTQGWRRYVWDMTGPVYQGQPFLTDGVNGTQTIPSKKRNKEIQNSQQLLQVSGPEGNALFVWTDSAGNFQVDPAMMEALRGGYLYLKPMVAKESKPTLAIRELFPTIDTIRKMKPHFYPVIDLSQTEKETWFEMPAVSNDSTILLEEVVVTRKARRPFRDKFMGRLDSMAQKDLGPWVCKKGHLENYKDGYTCHHDPRYCPEPYVVPLEERSAPVEGKVYYIFKPKYHYRNDKSGLWFEVEASEYVEYHGPIYSEEELLRRNNLWRTKGYYAKREFYQPDEVDRQMSLPDARNTLYWNPAVVTDEKGEASVTFYCSDINTLFVGCAEGVDGLGLLGSSKCQFRVIRNIK